MDIPLFMIADFPVTAMHLAIAGAALLAALLAALVDSANKAATIRAEAAARQLADEQQRQHLLAQLAERDSRIHELDHQVAQERERGTDLLDLEREKSTELLAELSAVRARMAEQAKQAEANLERFINARQQMTDEFKAIAGDVLKIHSETFTKQNREQVDVLLKPLQEKIVEFQTNMIKDRSAMGEQIRALHESNLQITTEAQ